ncbi:MAG: Ig-like domain-containing protein [Nitrospirae bacterium]|nr:Ig-like domain-containing protein [Nitrospirota bacterium]
MKKEKYNMVQYEIKEQRSKSFRLMMSGIFSMVFSCVMFLSSVTASAATYYVQPDNTTNVGADGTCNVASGQVTTAPAVRTTVDAVGNGATASSYRPTTGMSNGTWTVMMKVYGPVYSGNAVDISAVTTAKFSIRGYNATDQWTFHLYDYDPAGAAGNKTLVATSQTITSGTGGTVAVNPTYTINGTGRVQQNHRLLLEIAYMPGGTTYTPRIYYDTTGATTEGYITVTETPVASGDTLTASGNTAIAAANPTDGTTGILMQRFQADSNNAQNGQIELTSLNLTDNGNATSIQDAKVYISTTGSTTLPVGATLIGSTGVWNGAATVITLNGGTAADRTVSTGTPKFIYIVYDLAAGQTANTIQSSVTGVGVAAPDTGAGNVGTSNLLTIQPCSDPTSSTITVPASQTAYGDPYDVSGMYSTTGNVGTFQYKVTTGSGTSTITQQSTWAQQYANTAFPNGTVNANYIIGAGANRLLIVAISSSTTNNATQTVSVSYGGQSLTLAAGDAGTSRWNHSYLYYLNDAGITAATGTNLNVTVSGGTTYYHYVYAAVYSGVDQSAPISNARNYNSSTADSAVGPFNPTLTVDANEQAVEIINLARSAAGTVARTITTFATGWTTAGISQTYIAVNGPTVGLYIRDRAVPGTLTNDGSQHTANSANTYDSMTAMSMHPAPALIICTDWTSNLLIPASTAGGSLCGNYTNGNSYTLDVRGTDPDCGTLITTTATNFTWNSDGTAPSVTDFIATTPSTSFNIPITSFTASDNVAVTGYKTTTSATPPLAGDAGWTGTAPSTFTVVSDATYTLYPWAKDAAGNVSAVFATPRTVVVDTTAPSVSSTIPTNGATGVALNSSVSINWSENVNCASVNTTNITSTSPGWTLSTCTNNQAVFTTSGQAYSTLYSVTVTTAVTDTNGNPMAANYSFSYTTISAPDLTAPSSSVTTPSNGAVINSASANPFTISGSATDNAAVTGIEVSTNGGTTWNAATCTGCPGANVTWSYSWTLPTDGSYIIMSRAIDSSSNVETPGAGNTVSIDRTAPSVSSTVPVNGATGVVANSSVTINWNENVDCATVTTTNITSTSPVWTLSTCSANQAVFTTSGQGSAATYSVTVTTGVRDSNNNPMAANYSFSYTTVDTTAPSSTITSPANGATLNSASANPYTISGSAADNVAVQGIEVSTNGGTSWATATCTGCPGANVTWSYSWTLPADGSYNIRSRATDTLNIIETPGAGNTVAIDRTAPTVSSTIPANGATGIVANSTVTINWSENVNCATVNATNVTSTSPGWTFSTCSTNQAVFTTSGQASVTAYSVTATTGVTDANGNAMAAPYALSFTTADAGAPSSAITGPANGAILNSASSDPYTISGPATDNAAVTGIEVSTNGGTTWNAATCTGCPGANVTWTYSWTLPADGSYTIRSRATDSSSNVETPGTGNTVSIDRMAPSVSSTIPVNGATGVALNSSVTITWSENVDCATVNTVNITSTSPGWTLSTCSTNQAVFTTSGQAGLTTYTVTTSTSVTDANCNPMSSPYPFSYTTADVTSPAVTAFTVTTPSTSLNVQVTSFTANDNVGVTGYKITTSATPPLAGDAGWTGTAPSTYTVAADGTYLLYPWAKDAAGNISAVFATPRTVVVDTTAPTVSSTIPANSATGVALNSSVTITWSENVNCATVNTLNITSTSPGWTLSTCSGNQAVFTTSGQANVTVYSATVTTGVTDANGNAMSLNYSFSYTTADASAPSSAITGPANGAILNSASSDPYTISGSATDNAAVTGIEVSTNGGTTWNAATCTVCPGANVTWTYSWTLPADGSFTIMSRATDSSSNVETPGTGNTVSIDRTAPSVSSTLPANGATGVALNSSVTINWSENVDCTTVNTINITSTSPGWTLSTCSTNQAVFTTSGQINATAYSVTITTAVRDATNNPMASNYLFSYTTVDTAAPSSTVTAPANGAALNSASANPFTVSGSATDNVAVSGIEVSTNGGTTWNAATCTGCPGANVTWTYSWTLPADGSYTIRSRATDSSSNLETPGAGNTVSIDRTAPSVISTIPANGATGVASNSNVTINWSENVNCATVNTTNVTISGGGWTLSTCSANQAVFTTSGQGSATTYNVTVTTGVNDANNNPMAANYSFSYTTTDTTSPTVTAFTSTSPSTSLNIPVTSFTANDNAGVTGYKITTSAIPPLAGDAGWTATAPSTFSVASDGTYNLYPWAKDASGNVSAVFATPVTVVVDTTAPAVSSTIPANGATGITLNSNVTITWSENVDCATVNTINITSASPGWTLSTCSTNQAVFTTSGQASITAYSVTVTTGVKDTAGNAMSVNYSFSFTTADAGAPSSAITNPANGAILNSASSNPFTISGSATDNAAVTGIEVSTNGGTTWSAATCTGCPGANVTWSYSWTLPADGSYTIRSRATDSSSNIETPGAGNAVTVDRTAPAVSSTVPVNGATGAALNSNVTITWSENVNCSTVNTVNITSTSPGWTLSTCSGNQAVFTTSGQSGSTAYSVTITTAVTDANSNPMPVNYSFSYTTADTSKPTSTITSPANGAILNSASANPFTISGSATDNTAVSGIEVSTNGGATWNAATCAGCPGANVTWTYSWTLPADGSYNLKSRATDSSNNVETLGAGNTVTIDRTAPAVSSTIPANGATGVAVNSNVTITWSENVNCATVNTLNITSTNPGWTLSTCAGCKRQCDDSHLFLLIYNRRRRYTCINHNIAC